VLSVVGMRLQFVLRSAVYMLNGAKTISLISLRA
jgi:hypothetical protein